MITINSAIENLKDFGNDEAPLNECLESAKDLGFNENDKIYGLVEDDLGYCGSPQQNKFWEKQNNCCRELEENQASYIEDEKETVRYFIIESKSELDIVKKHNSQLLRNDFSSIHNSVLV